MKRSIAATVFAMALIWPASVAAALPSWNLTGSYTLEVVCLTGACPDPQPYVHSMTITSSNTITGEVVGSGFNVDLPYLEWTLTGTVSGSAVEFEFLFTEASGSAGYNPRVMTGSIDSTGGMSGTAVDSGGARTFTWRTTAGAATPIDRTAPTATFTAVPASSTNAATLSYTVTFSEPVSGLVAGDFTRTGTATGCSVGAPTGTGPYTVAVTGCSEGTVILALAADSVTDADGNSGPAAIVTAATVTIDRTAPTASSPAVKPRVGAALSGSSVPLTLTWYARDNAGGAGVARYELAQSRNGAAWTTVSTSLTSKSASVTAASSGTIRYRVRAVDAAGNATAWMNGITLSPRLVQQTTSSVKYSGTWTSGWSSSFSGGSVKYAKAASRSVTYKLTGRSIALVTTKSPSRGKVKVYVNGAYVATVDLYGSSTQYRALAWQKTWSSSGTRTVKLVVAGTSGRPRVDLDAFVVVK